MFQKQNFPFRSLCVSFIPTPGEPELITCQQSTGSLDRDRANYKVYVSVKVFGRAGSCLQRTVHREQKDKHAKPREVRGVGVRD